ncbi:MAG: hypothetical protein AB7F43_03030 [Bacteriovoracia bacterium]
MKKIILLFFLNLTFALAGHSEPLGYGSLALAQREELLAMDLTYQMEKKTVSKWQALLNTLEFFQIKPGMTRKVNEVVIQIFLDQRKSDFFESNPPESAKAIFLQLFDPDVCRNFAKSEKDKRKELSPKYRR